MPVNNPISIHPELLLLDFASAGHTDFAGTKVPNTFQQDQTMSASIVQAASATPGTPPSSSVSVFVRSVGSSPNEVVTWNVKLGDGSETVLSSIIL
jgi:hypothetical protein